MFTQPNEISTEWELLTMNYLSRKESLLFTLVAVDIVNAGRDQRPSI